MAIKSIVQLTLALSCVGCMSKGANDALARDHQHLKLMHQSLASRCEADRENAILTREDLQEAFDTARLEAQKASVEKEALEAHVTQLAQEVERLQTAQAYTAKKSSKFKASFIEMKRALNEHFHRREVGEKRTKLYLDLVRRLQSLSEQAKARVGVRDGRVVISMSIEALFHATSARLTHAGGDIVREVTRILLAMPESRYEVAAYAHRQEPAGTGRASWLLAFQRAKSVMRSMASFGFPESDVRTSSHREFLALASHGDEQGRPGYRRVELVIIPDYSTLPGSEELNALSSQP